MNGEYYLNFKSKQQEFDPNDPTSIIAGIVIFGGFLAVVAYGWYRIKLWDIKTKSYYSERGRVEARS